MDDFMKLFKDIKNAKEKQSEHCAEGDMHDFKFMMHSDGRDSFSNYFKCSNCNEIVVQRQLRTGTNKELWK